MKRKQKTKTCKACKKRKKVQEFRTNLLGKISPVCRECMG